MQRTFAVINILFAFFEPILNPFLRPDTLIYE